MKKLTLSFLFVFVITGALWAQTTSYTAAPLMDLFRMEQMTEESVNVTLTEKNIGGSPYLEDEFKKGTIYTTTKMKFENVLLRYNIYNDHLEFETPDKKVLALDKPETVELADFGEYKMTYLTYEKGNKQNQAFFKIIEQGKASLYAKPDVQFQKEVESDGIKPAKPAEFISKPDVYFIKIGSNAAKKIGNKKDVLAAMEDHSKEILAYIKQNKVKFNKSEQLQKLVQYYNSL
jgi:hypothetical protein